jgi:hypothetical protein
MALRRSDFLGAKFTGQNKVRCVESGYVCEPCVWSMAGKPPDTLRLSSHLLDDRGWLRPNKGAKPLQREWLREPKAGEWFAAIADSGKKHVVPWAPVNPSGLRAGTGQVLFEERLVTLGDWTLVDDLSSLLTAGASKERIDPCEYSADDWLRCREEIERFEDRWSRDRSGDWWTLAIWLAQRDEAAVAVRQMREMEERDARKVRTKKAARRHGGDALGDARRVSRERREPAQALGPNSEPASVVCAHVVIGGGVVHGDESVAAAGGSQLGLF